MSIKYTQADFDVFSDILMDYCQDELHNNDLASAFRKIKLLQSKHELNFSFPSDKGGPLHGYFGIDFAYLFCKEYLNIDLANDLDTWIKVVNAIYNTDKIVKNDWVSIYTCKELNEIKIDASLRKKYGKISIIIENEPDITLTLEEGITSVKGLFLCTIHASNITINLPSTLRGHLDLFDFITAWKGGPTKTFIINIKAIKNKEGKKESPFELSKQQLEELKKNNIDITFNLI